MIRMTRTAIAPPLLDRGSAALVALDADMNADGNVLLAVGVEQAASHLVFGNHAPVRPPVPLHACRARLLDPNTALVWGAKRQPYDEPDAWTIDRAGSSRAAFSAVQYCADAFCTDNHIVLTYFDDHMGCGDEVADQGVAVFDRTGAFQWGWNDTINQAAPIDDCDAAVALGGDRIGVFLSYEFPLVVLDIQARRPVVVYHPTPDILRGSRAISMRDDTWYFVGPHAAKEAVFAWRPARREPEIVAQIPARCRIRGLQDGRFINVAPNRVEVMELR